MWQSAAMVVARAAQLFGYRRQSDLYLFQREVDVAGSDGDRTTAAAAAATTETEGAAQFRWLHHNHRHLTIVCRGQRVRRDTDL